VKKNQLERAFKNVINKRADRPMLNCLHFDQDGSITATDSHVLLRLSNTHNLKTNFNLNLLSFTQDVGAYPETSKLIPDTYESAFTLNQKDIDEILTFLKPLKGDNRVKLVIENGGDPLLSNGASLIYPKFHNYVGETVSIALKATYLYNALAFFKDYLTPNEDVDFWYNGSLRPLALKVRGATYLITPVRTY
jgi:DNA polymerase III sliding clamp (beta) subunit (PCNA family)